MHPESTCWTVIRGAAAGSQSDRDEFARRYAPVVREYLATRWRSPALRALVDDGLQEVFVECFREGGILGRADPGRSGGFRPFLFGVARNVAMRLESNHAKQWRREAAPSADFDLAAIASSEESLSVIFDRAWAKAVIQAAAALHADRAREAGEAAVRRVELLRLRFFDGLPIRDIATRWGADAAELHHEYAKARMEFRLALRTVVAFDVIGTEAEVEAQCKELLALLNRS